MEEKKEVKKKKSSGVKKILVGFLAVGLIVGTTVAATLALLGTNSNTVENTFTASQDIDLKLAEPNYDSTGAGSFQPGESYDKDPTLYNTTGKKNNELAEEWVAMRVDYSINGTATAYSAMCADTNGSNSAKGVIEDITFDETNWIQITPSTYDSTINNPTYQIWIYKYKLKAAEDKTTHPTSESENATWIAAKSNVIGGKTTPLFSSVQVKSQDKLLANGYLTSNLPGFTIKVSGAAVKHSSQVPAAVTDLTTSNIATDGDAFTIVQELVGLLKDKATS